ncbi:MAG: type I methionyl aminopeptidase [Planctomycetota bacterium]
MAKAKRNDPCPCGSGKKFKKCCGADGRAVSTGVLVAPPPARRPPPRRRPQGRPQERAPRLNEAERQGMRAAGAFNAHLMDQVRPKMVPGLRLDELDDFVRVYTQDHGHIPACLGYKGFPKSCCTSVNEVICHGIPDGYVLREGDIVNVDLTTIVAGWHGDSSETFLIGQASDEARGVVQCSFDCLYAAIDAIGPGSQVIEIGQVIQKLAHARGYSVVEAFQGHGIGRTFHTDPGVPHYPEPQTGGFVLEPGMCFTIEPMINVGTKKHRLDQTDGWTARTADGKLSAQFEHTLLMTEQGVEMLTRTELGPQPGHRF